MRCEKCKRNMLGADGELYTGFAFAINDGLVTEDFLRMYPELDKHRTYAICIVCWLKIMGMVFEGGR